ncbi:hypothetical protein SH203_01851 [Brevundimonas sp. SH203]|uniref:hypothetical protein n=1 Tax=Brevundimonas sp. SH203 TaxID=345167 RepID=UPI0009D47391|nr:hypothetical protein [Brevundimonas sp. SH203]GAW41445.1 hypothetical protein SH203_01851 [Brevundimonas sp. SH203]
MPQARDPRSDLPGDAGPPVEGRRWAWVKVGAWGGAIVVLLCAAAVATWLVARVQTALTDRSEKAEPGIEVVETLPEPAAATTPAPAPAPVIAPEPVAPPDAVARDVEPVAPPPPVEAPVEATPPRRPLLMQH